MMIVTRGGGYGDYYYDGADDDCGCDGDDHDNVTSDGADVETAAASNAMINMKII